LRISQPNPWIKIGPSVFERGFSAASRIAVHVSQARAHWQQVAHLLDVGEAAETESAQVKLLTTEMPVRVTNQAMQLHGGNGYTTERRVERYWRGAARRSSRSDCDVRLAEFADAQGKQRTAASSPMRFVCPSAMQPVPERIKGRRTRRRGRSERPTASVQ
jgi:hypothetical protein